jgi:hypothetical protein
VNESGNQSDVPDERFLVYRDVGLIVTADPDGLVDQLIAVADRPHIFSGASGTIVAHGGAN